MPIGIVSDDDLTRELTKLSGSPKPAARTVPKLPLDEIPNPIPKREVEIITTNKSGDARGINSTRGPDVPDSLRKIIGEEALLNGRASAIQLAEHFGVSKSSASAYANGATSTTTYNEPKQSIISHINKARQRAVKKASKTLNAALDAITQEKLDYADADKLSGIAKDMSAIIKNLEPTPEPSGESGKQTPQFVIFAPQFRDERSFEVITVQE